MHKMKFFFLEEYLELVKISNTFLGSCETVRKNLKKELALKNAIHNQRQLHREELLLFFVTELEIALREAEAAEDLVEDKKAEKDKVRQLLEKEIRNEDETYEQLERNKYVSKALQDLLNQVPKNEKPQEISEPASPDPQKKTR